MSHWFNFFSPHKKNTHPAPSSISQTTLSENVQQEIHTHGTPKIRIIFMGTPALAASLLSALVEAKYHIICVITKPDKSVGRKQEMTSSPVKQKALEYALPIEQPKTFDEDAIQKIKDLKPDMIIVAAYGKILPKAVINIPGFGCVNIHMSLLPRWRGASPVQNALLAGDTETGVTIMRMDEGMDTGSIIAQQKTAIDPDETREILLSRLTEIGKTLLLKTIPHLVKLTIQPTPQNDAGATLCQLIEREDGHIIWTDDAVNIYNRYRALSVWPGTFSFWRKGSELLRIKFHRLSYQKQSPQIIYPIGQVFEMGEKIGVQTGSGVIFLEDVQLEGKTPLPIAEFILGNRDIINSFLQ